MTTISAKSILASVSADTGKRIDTLLLRYPWIIHSEAQTHRILSLTEDLEIIERTPTLMADRALSKNAGSTRAIPVEKMIQSVLDDPFVPLFWGKNERGMRAGEECREPVFVQTPMQYVKHLAFEPKMLTAKEAWLNAMDLAIRSARAFAKAGYHKQIVNRLLAPFSHITVVVTATEWDNFFALRLHEAAEPHMRMLAQAMKKAMDEAEVQTLCTNEWHLPFVSREEVAQALADKLAGIKASDAAQMDSDYWRKQVERDMIKLSVARCASTSYKTVDGFDMTLERAAELYDKLLTANPMHASPFEHQATPDRYIDVRALRPQWRAAKLHGNLVGFVQFRKTLAGECARGVSPCS
jgi:Thymidylate synthase complementing protein